MSLGIFGFVADEVPVVRFFHFGVKLHRHTLKTIFNFFVLRERERHIIRPFPETTASVFPPRFSFPFFQTLPALFCFPFSGFPQSPTSRNRTEESSSFLPVVIVAIIIIMTTIIPFTLIIFFLVFLVLFVVCSSLFLFVFFFFPSSFFFSTVCFFSL